MLFCFVFPTPDEARGHCGHDSLIRRCARVIAECADRDPTRPRRSADSESDAGLHQFTSTRRPEGADSRGIVFPERRSGGSIDLSALANELGQLRSAMKSEATKPEHDEAVGAVASAEKAAKQGDGPKALERLSTSSRQGSGLGTSRTRSAPKWSSRLSNRRWARVLENSTPGPADLSCLRPGGRCCWSRRPESADRGRRRSTWPGTAAKSQGAKSDQIMPGRSGTGNP
jgi:hypothetical protein